jgi:pantoate--beta-alanine ligase
MSPVVVDYIEIVDKDTLEPVALLGQRTLVAVAVRLGDVRLIDNVTLEPRAQSPGGGI